MSITSANSVYTITVPGIFAAPQRLQQFATDDIYGTETLKPNETMMGVDGNLTGGFVFVEVKQSINLMADSSSGAIFDQWWQFMQVLQDAYPCYGAISLPSLGQSFVLNKGFLTAYQPLPDAGKTLKARKFEITFQSIIMNPLQAAAPVAPVG
jgi:hypothetical protein